MSVQLYVSFILQEAVIIVDEEGTEATAATIASLYTNFNQRSSDVPVFRADRTFQYVVRYIPTNTILFTGVYDG